MLIKCLYKLDNNQLHSGYSFSLVQFLKVIISVNALIDVEFAGTKMQILRITMPKLQ